MKILHLCSDFHGTNVYREFFLELDKYGLNQIIYAPVKREKDLGKRIDLSLKNAEYIYSNAYNDIDRFFYRHKIRKLIFDIKSKIDLREVTIIHAHFLFSMGGIALELKKEFGIEYIVSFRNADLNHFFKYRPFLRYKGKEILKNSNNINFISPAYKKRLFSDYLNKAEKNSIENKCRILPNGINDFWLKNKTTNKKFDNSKINLLCVGELDKNKNITSSIKVTTELASRGWNVSFGIVGKGKLEKKIKTIVKKESSRIRYLGFFDKKEDLLSTYRKYDIFLMPSFEETFGLVYLEALSQGLPIIYTKGEGIDGFFDDGIVGFSNEPKNIKGISNNIEAIINNYEEVSSTCLKRINQFSWKIIVEKYLKDCYPK